MPDPIPIVPIPQPDLPDTIPWATPSPFIPISTTNKVAKRHWVGLDPGITLFPAGMLADTNNTVVSALAPGSYRVATSESSICITTVVVGNPTPAPAPWTLPTLSSMWTWAKVQAGPALLVVAILAVLAFGWEHWVHPTPGPVPPIPSPTDPFISTLQAAYATDTDANKATLKGQLAAVFAQGSSVTVNDTSLKSVADLLTKMQANANADVGASTLKNARSAIGAELASRLPTAPSTPLDATTRSLCGKQFARISSLLGAIK